MGQIQGLAGKRNPGKSEYGRESRRTGKAGDHQVPGGQIRILSGSENQELETIIQECSEATGVEIQMEYKGSVDIMRELEMERRITMRCGRPAVSGSPWAIPGI